MESISSGRWFYKEDNIRGGGIWVSAIRKRGKLYRNGTRGRWYDERKLLHYLDLKLCSTVVSWLFSRIFQLACFILGEIFLIWCGKHQVARLPFNLGKRILSYGNHRGEIFEKLKEKNCRENCLLCFHPFKVVMYKGIQHLGRPQQPQQWNGSIKCNGRG